MAHGDIILNLAISLTASFATRTAALPGSAARETAWPTADHFSFDGFLASCDTIVMGRKAYEDCLSSLPEAAEKRFLVASRTPRAPEGPVSFLSADVVAEVLALKDRPGKHIWLFGGGELASDFIRADAVDRYIVGILPVIRGKGRRLFQEGIPPVELHLDRCTVSDGIPILGTAGGAGEKDRQQPQGAFPAAVVLRFEKI